MDTLFLMPIMVNFCCSFLTDCFFLNSISFLKAKYLNDSLHYGLGYSWNNSFDTSIFSGAVFDSYKLQVYVQIYDNGSAFTIYEIQPPIIVQPDVSNLKLIQDRLLLEDMTFIDYILLNEGDYLESIKIMQCLSSLVNDESLSDKLSLAMNVGNTQFPELYGPLENYQGVTPVSKN